MNHLNKTVSCYECANTHYLPKNVNLLIWLNSPKHKAKVDFIRNIKDEKYKKLVKRSLPCITVAGIFSGKEESTMIHYNGLISLDFDNVADISGLKTKLSKLPCIAYCGVSVSGNGLWAIVPVSDKVENYKAHYEALKEELKGYGIENLDALPDLIRFRFYSYDDNAYFNHNAEIYTRTKHREKINSATTYCGSDAKYNQVLAQIEILASRGVDITETYSNWIKIGAAFNNQFGENGRHLFHKISAINGGYNYEKCDKQYDKLAKMRRVSIATFFHLTKDYVL